MLYYHWTLEIPFNILLVHNIAFETQETAKIGLKELPKAYKNFKLLRDDEISSTDFYKLSVPLKRG